MKTPSGIKEFKVSTNETKWGKPYFTYTDKVPYQHKVYEFALPLKEIGMGSAEKKNNILLAFSAYGTAAYSGNSDPSLAYDSQNNRYLLVYRKSDIELTPHIYGQLINCDGTAFGEEFLISEGELDKVSPSVAYDSANQRFLVVWHAVVTGGDSDIYGQLVNANGTLNGPNFVISNGEYDQRFPKVAYDNAHQRFLVVWQDTRREEDYYDIYGQLVNANGTLNGFNFVIANADGIQARPAVSYDSSNQRFLVVWADYRGTDYDIYAQYVQASGTLSGSNFIIIEADNPQLAPAVAYNSNFANFVVAYEARIFGEGIIILDIGLNLVGPACVAYTLTVTKSGTGSGTVTSSPSGINCGTDCSEAYRVNALVTLTASASTDSIFTGWSGDADCADGQVTMDADKNCIANFDLISFVQEEIKIKGGGGCFIATAAFGSYLDPRVQVLRSFRDNYLLNNALGRAFVSFYYEMSPPLAEYISKHEFLITATRWALTPLVYALQYPGIALVLLLGLVVAPLAGRRLKKIWPLLIIVSLLAAGPAMALQGHIFEPQVGEEKFVTRPSSSTIPQGKYRFGLFLDYAKTPVETTTGIELSNRQFVGTFLAGLGITDALQMTISVSYLFDQGGKKIDLVSDISSWRFGDVNIAAKYRVFKEKEVGIGLAVSPFLVLNTGQEHDWFGNNSFSGGLQLILDKNLNNKTAIAFNLGYQIKKKEQLTSTQRIEDMILYGLGIAHAFTSQLTLIGEIYGYTASTSAFEKYLSPLEGDISLAYKVCPCAQLVLGGGGAITKGVGAPEWRILTGMRFGF
ncbi:MAG: CFI-box-CTERM domain-containing protein [Thermodesulfobacteriota bacterium]